VTKIWQEVKHDSNRVFTAVQTTHEQTARQNTWNRPTVNSVCGRCLARSFSALKFSSY